jgi:hypothetical protein
MMWEALTAAQVRLSAMRRKTAASQPPVMTTHAGTSFAAMQLEGETAKLIGVIPFDQDYAGAEMFAEQWAGDCNARAAVVEDFGGDVRPGPRGVLLVMDYDAAVAYCDTHNAEIQHDADHREKPATEGGQ